VVHYCRYFNRICFTIW